MFQSLVDGSLHVVTNGSCKEISAAAIHFEAIGGAFLELVSCAPGETTDQQSHCTECSGHCSTLVVLKVMLQMVQDSLVDVELTDCPVIEVGCDDKASL